LELTPYEKYKAKQVERERRLKDNAPMPLSWFGQRDPIARFTFYVGVFTLLLVVVGALQTYTLINQLDEARIEQRPWVYTDPPVIVGRLSMNDNGWWVIPLEFDFHNTGHLPARAAVLNIEQHGALKFDEIQDIQKKQCGFINRKIDRSKQSGDPVFPGQVFKLNGSFGISGDEWGAASGSRNSGPWFVGCILYQQPGSNEYFWTRIAYRLMWRKDPSKIVNDLLPTDLSSLPADQIVAVPVDAPGAFDAN